MSWCILFLAFGALSLQTNERTPGIMLPEQSDFAEPCPYLTSDQGVKIQDDQNTEKISDRGPSLLEDFLFREKITHFDHERIPERVVHARGSGAHGYFQVYESMKQYTKAQFLQDPSIQTPVFVRFSTVVGFKGSADTVRDVRGFATKFYTQEGNYDLVGNNIPVFFIQDAIKFPDLIHAAKPEQDWAIPQASTAHDTFYDFIYLTPESMHMIMWTASDRALPRSFSLMEGFGVHTFRLINAAGNSSFVKFHWKPVKGVASFTFEEARVITGADPDFHRRDLWESIQNGNYPEFELGVQILQENEVNRVQFDILDATKLWPEEVVPVQKVGKMTLNRNPDNFHDETEQVAFHVGNLVPGIDVTDDPLLQGRLFSYLDTQLLRLGGPNFHEIPINQAAVTISNNQREGWKRHTQDKGKASYFPNSIGGGCPMQAPWTAGGWVSYPERIYGPKIRKRPASFSDYYCQGTLFWNSMSVWEQRHIIDAFAFEFGKVQRMYIREKMVDHLNHINYSLAVAVAERVGVDLPLKRGSNACCHQISPALSLENLKVPFLKGKKVAILVTAGVDNTLVEEIQNLFNDSEIIGQIISTQLGTLPNSNINVDQTYLIATSVLFDAVLVIGQNNNDAARHFVRQTYRYSKAIGAIGYRAGDLLQRAIGELISGGLRFPSAGGVSTKQGVVIADVSADVHSFWDQFKTAVEQYRFWEREKTLQAYSD